MAPTTAIKKSGGLNLLGLIQSASALIQRARLGSAYAKTFSGNRDMYVTLGYPEVITAAMYRARYDRGGIAGRIVDVKPEDTWRGGAYLMEEDDPEKETPFEEATEALVKKFKLWSLLQQADTLSGIGRYAVILIGAPGEMDQPLEKCGPEELAYLSVYSEEDATIESYEEDNKNPRFGRPKFYTINRAAVDGKRAQTITGKRVHYTRVHHVVDGVLDDVVFGSPRMRRVWNLLDDLDKVTGGGAEAFWRRADGGTQLDLDPTVELTADEEANLETETDEFIHGFKRVMRTRGLTVNRMGSDVADIKGPAEGIIMQISASIGVPQRILMGSEQAKLASEQDRTNWDRRIEARRAEYAGPHVVRPFFNWLISLGVLPEPGEEYEVVWSQVNTLDEGEQLALADKAAGVNQKMGKTVVTVDEIRDKFLGLAPLREVDPDADAENNREKEPAAVAPGAPFGQPKTAAGKEGSWRAIHRSADRFPGSYAKGRKGRFLRRPKGHQPGPAAGRPGNEG